MVSVLFCVTAALTVNPSGNASRRGSTNTSQVLEAILAVVTIPISYSCMGCLARLKYRAENVRVVFLDTKLLKMIQGVFTMMSKEGQKAVPTNENPFGIDLENRIRRFYQVANNYNGMDDTDLAKSFIDSCNLLRQDINNTNSIRQFQTQLSSDAMYGVRHETSVIQNAVADLYDWCSIRLRYLDQQQQRELHFFQENPRHCSTAETLYKKLCVFKGSLEKSALRQNVPWWQYWWRSMHSARWNVDITTFLQGDVFQIYGDAYMVSCYNKNTISPRQVYDIHVMASATTESEFTSTFLIATFLLHLASWVVATCRVLTVILGEISLVNSLPIRSTSAIFAFSVTMGSYPMVRKEYVLWNLRSILAVKVSTALTRDSQASILKIQKFVVAQVMVNTLRILGPWFGAYAVESSLSRLGFSAPSQMKEEVIIPSWMVLLGPISLAMVAWVASMALESYVFGKKSWYPQLGKDVMEAFHDELEELCIKHSIPLPQDIDPPSSSSSQPNQNQKPQEWAWEDVGYEFFHKYPLDLVFPVDWIASIVQCLQRGVDLDTNK